MNNTTTLLLGTAIALGLSSCGDQPAASAPSTGSTPAAAVAPAVPAGDLEEIKPEFPKPLFQGTPIPPGNVPNLEKPDPANVKKSFMAPKGTTLLSKGKKVTSSDPAIIIPVPGDEALKLLTDGDAESSDGCFVEMAPGPQWVQVDLEKTSSIAGIFAWHFHRQAVIVKGVVVQVSDDAEFKAGVTTIYNADIDNSCGQGKGDDKAWVQTNHGRFFDGKAAKGRYVRLWSAGNTDDDFNRYIEISVYGSEAK